MSLIYVDHDKEAKWKSRQHHLVKKEDSNLCLKDLSYLKKQAPNKSRDKSTTRQKTLQIPIYGTEGPIVITFKEQHILSATIQSNGGWKASTWARVLDPQTLSLGDQGLQIEALTIRIPSCPNLNVKISPIQNQTTNWDNNYDFD